MLYADRDGVRVQPGATGDRAVCPLCHAQVLAKCGDVVVHHWAHLSARDCDLWSEPESAWHVGWKSRFPEDWREVVVGEHRADVRQPCGLVVEFQHSPLGSEDIKEREAHYGSMVWVLDASTFTELSMRSMCKTGLERFRHVVWERPKLSWLDARRPVYLHWDDQVVRVVWVDTINAAVERGRKRYWVGIGVCRTIEEFVRQVTAGLAFGSDEDVLRRVAARYFSPLSAEAKESFVTAALDRNLWAAHWRDPWDGLNVGHITWWVKTGASYVEYVAAMRRTDAARRVCSRDTWVAAKRRIIENCGDKDLVPALPEKRMRIPQPLRFLPSNCSPNERAELHRRIEQLDAEVGASTYRVEQLSAALAAARAELAVARRQLAWRPGEPRLDQGDEDARTDRPV